MRETFGSEPTERECVAAMTQGRRRRRRSAVWAGGSAMLGAGVIAAALVSISGGSTVSLIEPAGPQASTSATTTATAKPVRAGATPLEIGAPPTPRASTEPGTGAVPSSGTTGDGLRARPGARRTTSTRVVAASCGNTTTLCLHGRADARGSGHGWNLIVGVCTNGVTAAQRLDFRTQQEIEFVVTSGDRTWRWSAGFRFAPQPHSVEVPASGCVDWLVPWDGRFDDGSAARPGDATMTATLLAEQPTHPTSVRVTLA